MWYFLFALSIFLFLVAIFVLCFYPKLKNNYYKKNYLKIYGKKVYKVALNKDLYLINRLKLPLNPDVFVIADHVLFGTKYIYVIKDCYFYGGLIAKKEDKTWLYFDLSKSKSKKKGKPTYVDNPLKENRIRINRLARITGLDNHLFISLVIVNNNCVIPDYKLLSDRDYLIPLKRLSKTITKLEAQNVSPINDEQLQDAVQDIAKLNVNKKLYK